MNAFCRMEISPFLARPSTVRIDLPLKLTAGTTGGAGVARPVGIIDDDRAAQALRRAAAELGTGHPEILAQKIVHRQFVAHLPRAVSAFIDGDGQHRHLSAPLIMAWVTGRDWKR